MSILIVGAGATGGYFGGRLAQAGRAGYRVRLLDEVRMLMRAPS